MYISITSFAEKCQCVTSDQGLKYGVVSILASIYEFLFEKTYI